MHPLHKNVLALACLLLVGALAWWWLSTDPVMAPAPSGSEPKAAAPAEAAANDSTPRQAVDVPERADALLVRGRVVDAFGEPVGRALVGDTAAAAPVHTATDGTFEVLVDAAPALTLLVLAAGHAPLLAPLEPGGVAVHDAGDLVLRNAGRIRGTVVSNEAVLPGATITLRLLSGGSVPAGLDFARLLPHVVTDAAGAYELAALMPGNYRVTAEAPGMQRGQSGSVTVREGQATVVDPIALAPGFALDGVVVGPGDRAVEGAEVRIRGGPNQGRVLATVTTAADGSFHAEALPPGPLRVAAKKQGFQPGAAEGDATRKERLVVRLPAGLQLRGVAVDASSGRPVERFALSVRRLGDVDPATNGTMQQQLQRRAAALRAEAAAASDAADAQRRVAIAEQFEARLRALAQGEALPAAVPADLGAEQQHAAGQFVCDGLEAGLYVVGVASPEHQYAESAVVALTAEAPAEDLRMSLAAGQRLAGVVVRARDGAAVAGARVELVCIAPGSDAATARSLYPWAFAKGKAGITLMATTTGSDGRFLFRPAAAGNCLLAVRHDDIADHDTEPFFLQGTFDLRIAVGERATLGGRVRSPARAGVTVLVLGGHGTLRTTKAQSDGSYHFAGLQPGSYLVRAFPTDQTQYQSRLLGSIFPLHAGAVDPDKVPSCDVTLAPGEQRALDLDLDVPATGSVQGSLAINGQPGRGGRAVLQPVEGEAPAAGGLSLRGDCDDSGRFAIADVPGGNYTLRLYSRSRQELHQQAITVTAGAVAGAPVEVHAGGLRGRILPTDAVAVADLRGYVWVLPGAETAPDDLYEYRRSHRTHRISVQAGAFEDALLTPGAAIVVAEIRGHARAVAKVVVPDGGVGALDLTVGTQ